MRYDFVEIEKRWQERWTKDGTFRVSNPGEPGFDPAKPKYYVLDMFPYPSGSGLHVGHPLGYIATDIVARYKRMRGYNVLHPMGFDAFGLPAEQYAVERGVHPRVTTERNIATYERQLKSLGLSYDWDRALSTTDLDYVRWTQWIFLQIFNSWFDPWQQRARPINELVSELGSAIVNIDAQGLHRIGERDPAAPPWSSLDEAAQRKLLDQVRLAFRAEVSVNWCPALGTVLANEEVTAEGRSERGNFPVYKRPLEQWMLRITAYAERLASDLDLVDWPESVATMQRNWIGRSDGAYADFKVADGDAAIRVFTTRPDTLFGATYVVLAPEHPLVDDLTTAQQRAIVAEYRRQAAMKSEVDRQTEAASGTKTGVFTGGYAINPANDARIPVWVADYVLMGYGTGAIMAVPASDQRDFEFACTFKLPIQPVVRNDEWLKAKAVVAGWTEVTPEQRLARYLTNPAELGEAYSDPGFAMSSANASISLDGLPTADAKSRITDWLQQNGRGERAVQYKLRDWLFSRQRYWGEPFPILHGPNGEIIAVDEADLPVALPEMEDFRPESSDDANAPPRPPLARAPESWRVVERDGQRLHRELNTMPQWAGSCWYYLRFLDPKNSDRFVSVEAEKYWMGATGDSGRAGVDLYVGGVEHAVLHLLYARFWHKLLFDLGHVSTPEPFGRLFNQGYILAAAYKDEREIYVDAAAVTEDGGNFLYEGRAVTRELGKMGKSLKNSIGPDEVSEQYGADTMRLYEMYLGPVHKSKVWNTHDILGVHRFLQRLWRNFIDQNGKWRISEEPATDSIRRSLHRTVKKVTGDMEQLDLNTAIAALIELNNQLVKLESLPREVAEPVVLLLAPLAPHVAEELWAKLGHDRSLAYEPWPTFDPALLVDEEFEYPVQINGKLRAHVRVPVSADDAAIAAAVNRDAKVQALLVGKSVNRVVVVRGRLVNLVAT